MIFDIELRLHRGKRSSVLSFGFAFDFLRFAIMKPLKFFTICEICSADHLKAEIFLAMNYEFFLSTGTRKGANMLNGPANIRKFHQRKRDKSCSKAPYFLWRKTVRIGIELRQDLYLSMRNRYFVFG